MGSNGHSPEEDPARTLVYLGPSLPLARAMEFLPFATYRPPAKQGDIVSDVVNYNPTRIFLIDGEFRQNLSVWHKELVYALQFPGLKAVYGASSMGALRAVELAYLGMIGVGKIFEWYRDEVTEDEAEVAVNFSVTKGRYRLLTVPLVDIRAGVLAHEDQERAQTFFERVRAVYYMDRTTDLCQAEWGEDTHYPYLPQKETDAIELLSNYRNYESKAEVEPEPGHLSEFFRALYERDRRIRINGVEVMQQHIDAHVTLHNPEYERICWDSANQELALMLCNCLSVMVTVEEVNRENVRFQQRAGLETPEQFAEFLANNGWTRHEYERVMIQNARIRKLQHSLNVTKGYRRNTQSILDYLRTHQGFEFWAREAMQAEERLAKNGSDDWMKIDLEKPVFTGLAEHMEREGLELKCNAEEYLIETGFSNLTELGVALARTKAGKE